MAKKAIRPQSRHHVMLYDEDWAFLEANYGPGSANARLGISGAIKEIVHQRILGLKAKINQSLDDGEAA